jgi:uronate dehydrogenase
VQRILITGAAGAIGTHQRHRLRRPDRVLRLLDVAPVPAAEPGEAVETVVASVTDPVAMAEACRDVDALIHLGGFSRETTWPEILATNIDGTHTVLEAARAAGISRIVLASSNHAAGFRPTAAIGADGGLPADSTPRPDTYYGVSKAAVEALGSLYSSRFGMDVICVRIGYCFEQPPGDLRSLAMWLSPDDCTRLLEACLAAPSPGYRIVWGVSDNTRRVVSLRETAALGYESADDSEQFAPAVLGAAASEKAVPASVGGEWQHTPLGEPNPL